MSRLYYNRWIQQFVIDRFSSEDSMRDYIFSHPALIFEEDDFVMPIIEESHLPASTLAKNSGRADIILCRVVGEHPNSSIKKFDMSNLEVWIVELKKEEASYKNGYEQLFDYLTVIQSNDSIQTKLKTKINEEIKQIIGVTDLEVIDAPITLCGALIAPSFDLIGRTQVKEIHDKDSTWKTLSEKLKNRKEDFTLYDAVDASRNLFSNICLIKLMRFRRGDEVIFYTENALGQIAAGETKTVDPLELFNQGILNENELFYFRSNNGKIYNNIKCKVLKRRGRSNSFMIKIDELPPDYKAIDIPTRWTKNGFTYMPKKLPIEGTTKNCSIALHRLYEKYDDDNFIKNYSSFGDKNFVREGDKKDFSELRAKLREYNS